MRGTSEYRGLRSTHRTRLVGDGCVKESEKETKLREVGPVYRFRWTGKL